MKFKVSSFTFALLVVTWLAGSGQAQGNLPPAITNQPVNQSLVAGQSGSLVVGVAGTPPLDCQWQFNGTNLANGIISTVAGNGSIGYTSNSMAITASLYYPAGVAVDGRGNLYLADTDNNRIRKVDPYGIITTVAGQGPFGYAGDGGPATNAILNHPNGVAVDAAGNLYIADTYNSSIRLVKPAGTITTLAGGTSAGFGGDGGLATNALLNFPYGVAVDGAGNVFIADTDNNRIRKVDTQGVITTVAGSITGAGYGGYAGDGGLAINADLNQPQGVAIDASGEIFIADSINERVRKVNASGIISTVAGIGLAAYSGDGGAATNAALADPLAVAVDLNGNLLIADEGNASIRQVDINGTITTVAGNRTWGYGSDNVPAVSTELNAPAGVAVDAFGTIYIADTYNQRIRMVNAAGIIATIAGNGFGAGTGYGGESFPGNGGYSGDRGPATLAELNEPSGVAADGAGNVYVADDFNNRVRRVNKQ